MRKKAFNMVEIAIVVSLLGVTILACLPTIFNNTRQAKIISKWKQLYGETKSNFEIFSINDYESVKKICAADVEDKEGEIFKIVGPYLNISTDTDKSSLKSYSYRFSNGAHVPMKSNYFTKRFAYQDSGNIVGFKLLSCDCGETQPCAMAVFDLNGKKGPNRLGHDIFGINIYRNKITAFGAGLSNMDLERECTKGHGSGAVCSEFYLRGGKF